MFYKNAELELVTFATEDVLVTSRCDLPAPEPSPTTGCFGQDPILPEEEL